MSNVFPVLPLGNSKVVELVCSVPTLLETLPLKSAGRDFHHPEFLHLSGTGSITDFRSFGDFESPWLAILATCYNAANMLGTVADLPRKAG